MRCPGLTVLVLLVSLGSLRSSDLLLRYDSPALAQFGGLRNPAVERRETLHPLQEALPIGNGRLGALLTGGMNRDRLILSENSLWTGDDSSGKGPYGAYQFLGELTFTLPGHEVGADYHGALDLGDALFRVGYGVNGLRYTREYLASAPAGVIAVRYATDKGGGGYTGTVALADSHHGTVVAEAGQPGPRITVSGQLENGLRYEYQVIVVKEGKAGTIAPGADRASIEVKGCDAVIQIGRAHV